MVGAKLRRMRILFAGRFEPDYNRTRILADGLTRLGVEVEMLPIARHDGAAGRVISAAAVHADAVVVPCFAHRSVTFVRRHCGGKPLVFDPLVSKYQTTVEDYRTASRWSFDALRCWWRDRSSLRGADLVLADTAQHLAYYRDAYGVPDRHLAVLPIGVDEELFAPPAQRRPNARLNLFFYGSFAPLQGVPVIIAAARRLASAGHRLRLVGGGHDEYVVKAALRESAIQGLEWIPTVPYEALPGEIAQADVCLGIFDPGRKASLVVPNKLYHYASCARCMVSLDTPALREVFAPDRDMVAVAPGVEALVEAINQLAADPDRIVGIGNRARQKIEVSLTRNAIAGRFLELLRDRLPLAPGMR